jgi:hypothetical protein
MTSDFFGGLLARARASSVATRGECSRRASTSVNRTSPQGSERSPDCGACAHDPLALLRHESSLECVTPQDARPLQRKTGACGAPASGLAHMRRSSAPRAFILWTLASAVDTAIPCEASVKTTNTYFIIVSIQAPSLKSSCNRNHSEDRGPRVVVYRSQYQGRKGGSLFTAGCGRYRFGSVALHFEPEEVKDP